jgi:hypothetical protein
MLSIPLYDIPRMYPSGLDNVTETMPLSTTNWKSYESQRINVKVKNQALVSDYQTIKSN